MRVPSFFHEDVQPSMSIPIRASVVMDAEEVEAMDGVMEKAELGPGEGRAEEEGGEERFEGDYGWYVPSPSTALKPLYATLLILILLVLCA